MGKVGAGIWDSIQQTLGIKPKDAQNAVPSIPAGPDLGLPKEPSVEGVPATTMGGKRLAKTRRRRGGRKTRSKRRH